MRHKSCYFVVAALVLVGGVGRGVLKGGGGSKPATKPLPETFTGTSYRMERANLVEVHVPSPEVDKALKAVVTAVGLKYGHYDQVAFLSAPGLEQFRPLDGSKAGKQPESTRVPTTNLSFSLPHDPVTLRKALVAIRYVHSYEEPVIYISEV